MSEGGGAAAPTFSFGLGVPTPSVDEVGGADDAPAEQDIEVRRPTPPSWCRWLCWGSSFGGGGSS
jgi:hypothetical protein